MTISDLDLTYQLVDRSLRMAAHVEATISHALGELGLSAPLANLLWQIDSEAPPTMGHLASLRYVDKATITGLIAKLEAKGFVMRREGPGDRRSRLVIMLPAGIEARDRLLGALSSATPFAMLGRLEQIQLLELLTKAAPVDPTVKAPWRARGKARTHRDAGTGSE